MSLFDLELDSTGNLTLKDKVKPAPVVKKESSKKEKKFRVAVCLSGQPRHWRIAAENIKLFFASPDRVHPENGLPVEVDFFIHTWDTNTWRKPKTNHDIFELVKHNDKEDIIAAFNPVGFEQEEFVQEKYPRAWDPMFYSFAKSLLLKREHELANQFEYDLVIKARLDVIYSPAHRFPLIRVWPGVCYSCTFIGKFPSEFNYNNFDDVLFYGDSPTMDLIGDIYATNRLLHSNERVGLVESTLNLDPTMWYGPGCLLYNHMTKLSIHPDGSRGFEYAVVRSTSVDENLDGIKDYEKIRKKWFEWYI
jgi:hypothetical protein